MLMPEPPEPVTALGNIDTLHRPGNHRWLHAFCYLFLNHLPGFSQVFPSLAVLVMSDPDGKIVVYPRAGIDGVQLPGRRMLAQIIADTHGFYIRIIAQPRVK